MSQRRGRLFVVLAGVASLAWVGTAHAESSACPGIWMYSAGSLTGQGAGPDSITVDGATVSIQSGCEAVQAKRKDSARGVSIKAKWDSCGAATKVALTMKITPDCRTAAVKVKWSGGKPIRPVLPLYGSFATEEEIAALRQQVPSHEDSPAQREQDEADRTSADQADLATLDAYMAQHPDLVARLTGAIDPADGNLSSADDGNFLLAVADTLGTRQTFVTYGPRWQRRAVADALRREPTLENQLQIYQQFYDWVTANDLTMQLATPSSMESQGVYAVRQANAAIATDLVARLDPAVFAEPTGGWPPAGAPATCAAEVGSGDGTDRSGTTCPHAADGIYSNRKWPLKFYATCVKNQANRGTCGSFALNAALETMVAKKHEEWINLSEQYHYFMATGIWWPSKYGDGMGTAVWKRTIDEAFATPYESDWDYNPSSSRVANDAAQSYSNSCAGYGGGESDFCSDTVSQGMRVCPFPDLNLPFLGLAANCFQIPPLSVGAQARRQTWVSELWDAGNIDLSFAKLVLAVALFQKPVLLFIPVPGTFDAPDANGYASHVGKLCSGHQEGSNWVCDKADGCECSRGGHFVVATGIIDNSQLPAGAPAGAGGGYLVVKNSWGTCWSDGGYIYLPYAWIKDLVWSASIFDIN